MDARGMHLRLNTLHLELLRWLLENDCPLDRWALVYATKKSRFEEVELIREHIRARQEILL